MITLIYWVVGVAGECSYMGHFLLCPWHYPCWFSKKNLRRAVEKTVKLWVLHKNDFLCNTRFLSNFPELPAEIFFRKLAWVMSGRQGHNKKYPQLTSIWTHPCHAYNSVYQGSHCSALLIGCVKYCSRLYICRYGFYLKYFQKLFFRIFHTVIINNGLNNFDRVLW